MAITLSELTFSAALVLAIASVPRSPLALRGTLTLCGAAGLAYVALRSHNIVGALACGSLMTISFVQFLFSIRWGTKVAMSAEEVAMVERCFPSIPRPTVRHLLDQGLWVQGKTGETLVKEGTPVTHLFYLSEGSVAVSSGGRPVATSEAGHFFGEITVLSGGPATATVTLNQPSRFWCVPADGLHTFLEIYPEYRAILEAAFAGDLRDKLRLTNQRLVSMVAEASGKT